MRIIQKANGDGKIIFTKEEQEIIFKKGHLKFEALTLKHFANTLVHIASKINERFDPKIQKILTDEGQHLEGK